MTIKLPNCIYNQPLVCTVMLISDHPPPLTSSIHIPPPLSIHSHSHSHMPYIALHVAFPHKQTSIATIPNGTISYHLIVKHGCLTCTLNTHVHVHVYTCITHCSACTCTLVRFQRGILAALYIHVHVLYVHVHVYTREDQRTYTLVFIFQIYYILIAKSVILVMFS